MTIRTDVRVSFSVNNEYAEAMEFEKIQDEYKRIGEDTNNIVFGKTIFSVIDYKDVSVLLRNKK